MSSGVAGPALIADLLHEISGRNMKRNGDEYSFTCPLPTHPGPDEHPSCRLNVEKMVYHCDVCGKGGHATELAKILEIRVATDTKPNDEYEYDDIDGRILYKVVRHSTGQKSRFHQEHLDDDGNWVLGLGDVRPVLYRLSELAQIPTSEVVLIVEGEKDVDQAWAFGYPATCNPMGAGKWRPDYSGYLAGRNIVIIADNDETGRKHMDQVAEAIAPVVAGLRIIPVMPGVSEKGDLSDWLNQGHSKKDLDQVIETSTAWADRFSLLSPPNREREERTSGWQATDVATLLSEPDKEPNYLIDDLCLVGGTSMIAARPKAGKTTMALNIASCVVKGEPFLGRNCQPGRVAYLSMEGSLPEAKRQMRQLGIESGMLYHHGPPPFENPIEKLGELITAQQLDLVVIDTLIKLFPGVDVNDYSAMSKAMSPIEYLASASGCHIMYLHHMNKMSSEEAGIGVLGSTVLQGAVDTIIELRRKDEYRQMSTLQRYGDEQDPIAVLLDGVRVTHGGSIDQITNARVQEQIRAVVDEHSEDEIGAQDLFDAISCNNNDFYPARKAMIEAGELIERSEGNRKFYSLAATVDRLSSIGGLT